MLHQDKSLDFLDHNAYFSVLIFLHFWHNLLLTVQTLQNSTLPPRPCMGECLNALDSTRCSSQLYCVFTSKGEGREGGRKKVLTNSFFCGGDSRYIHSYVPGKWRPRLHTLKKSRFIFTAVIHQNLYKSEEY